MSSSNEVLRSRFAPTPSGYLHIGNVFSFVLTWLYVKQRNGNIHLRIDDIDRDRVRPEYIDNIFATLDWLGLEYDTGPSNASEFNKNHTQLSRIDLYREAFERLQESNLLFSCYCSRKEIGNNPYPGTCRQNAKVEKEKNIRIKTDLELQKIPNASLGDRNVDMTGQIKDFVVWKKNGTPSYQLASIVDDIHFKNNCVVRGTGLLEATAAQMYLANQLGEDSFNKSTFIHHPLLKVDGHKISKSQSHPSVFDEFKTPRQVFIFVGNILGLSEEQSETLRLFKEHFNFDDYKNSIHA